MTTQPEYILEENLVEQLQDLGYEKVIIKDEDQLVSNLKGQLEKHNRTTFSDAEFKQILNQLSKGNIYEKAKTLRDRITYPKDNGETGYVELINQVHWCKNQYQVTHQVTMEGSYKNRYDVTILINGLPLVQVELKKRGLEMKEAFNQINRYERHSFGSGSGLFQYVQLFVISNGVNTKYFANNPVKARSFKQTFFWADRENNIITQLSEFAKEFLEPCHLSKMITKYIVLNTSNILMVLRPYQYYATEAIVERVKNSNKFGYIWHTTGSGKTLTSFKAAQILTNLEDVPKVVFVVDRKDLDYQTIKEFNSFSEGSIDATDNTSTLVKQLSDDTKLIVTTIQKLNTAISKPKHMAKVDQLKNERIVFIFDECHRSQFGDTHNAIKTYFGNAQMFGFTGTPIFADNSTKNKLGRRTTKDLFEECLHKYVITDAIRDRNVLKFSIEYMNTVKLKEEVVDLKVEDINTAEVLEAPERLENNVDFIINNHNRKTHNKRYTAIFCVQNVKTLITYYELFQAKKVSGEHDLKVATIYSYQANQLDEDAMGFIPDEDFEDLEKDPSSRYDTKHTRDKLDEYISDYNQMFKTNYSTNAFYSYYKDIGKRVKNREVDILLVVNMFLTGFDSKLLNTIYVDKNLKYHGLIQAYSRTNRILDEVKSQGNVVAFRNLKEATDEAITLFSNKEAIEEIVVQPYEDYIEKFDEAVERVKAIAPTFDSVNDLVSEAEELEFVKAFRELMRVKNVLGTFTEFSFEDLGMDEQTFENYKSKYLDLYDIIKSETQKEKVSILNDIDFELELIRRDEINVTYILTLLAKLHDSAPKEQEEQRKAISDILASESQLRSKKELIEKFIAENLPLITDSELVANEFESFWTVEKKKAIMNLAKEENLDYQKLVDLVSNYLFTEKEPLRDEIIAVMNERPSLRDRATLSERILGKVKGFVETFIDGMG
ncbi:type I restriction endonuclease subunit R [Flagellimonas zhangzhouensis]|uniref:Type I restriction enzyme endonuclease subunit n=1 Tax=Flagellimonas zhangzhouensis TaxID=1073328 RepID=A0A1H2RC75_9FLAO|nr:type I restriction endonuclease subunit R [Allomuricauda zhangzhouensis]SDQ61964.1 type I restriction enzyme, R subunit [Allomuricauda zhangzhouensis]SDW16915.1 type I restriction enzyme, R subunit [Allomuricauda zhangzhouensis]